MVSEQKRIRRDFHLEPSGSESSGQRFQPRNNPGVHALTAPALENVRISIVFNLPPPRLLAYLSTNVRGPS